MSSVSASDSAMADATPIMTSTALIAPTIDDRLSVAVAT